MSLAQVTAKLSRVPMQEEGSRMEMLKKILGAFVVGGAYGLIGQVLLVEYSSLLGADSPYLMFCVLVSLGVLAFVLYVPGIHQKIASVSGFGSILPFNGFACGVADAYGSGQTAGQKLVAAMKLVLFVMGLGSVVVIVIAAVAQAL